jgi:hypothetical protein
MNKAQSKSRRRVRATASQASGGHGTHSALFSKLLRRPGL